MNDADSRKLFGVIGDCLGHLKEVPEIDSKSSPLDGVHAIVDQIVREHRTWLVDLWNPCQPTQEPWVTKSGEISAEPLFSFQVGKQMYTCFGTDLPRKCVLQRLEYLQVKVIAVGEAIAPDAS